jgi:hypothetical protein
MITFTEHERTGQEMITAYLTIAGVLAGNPLNTILLELTCSALKQANIPVYHDILPSPNLRLSI